MVTLVDSYQYRCWHELGHATACLHFGGKVEFIEMLFGDLRGHGRTRCEVLPGTERHVACGGFAAEFFLLNRGYAARAIGDERDISQIVFHNATHDREAFWGRKLRKNEFFSEGEDRAFMNHALRFVVPVFDRYAVGMARVVHHLGNTHTAEGYRIRELLGLGPE